MDMGKYNLKVNRNSHFRKKRARLYYWHYYERKSYIRYCLKTVTGKNKYYFQTNEYR